MRERKVEPVPAPGSVEERPQAGLLGNVLDYEGGFLMMAVDRIESPCLEWHRNDFS